MEEEVDTADTDKDGLKPDDADDSKEDGDNAEAKPDDEERTDS